MRLDPSSPTPKPPHTRSPLSTDHQQHHGRLSSLRALEPPAKANANRQRHPGHKLRPGRQQHLRMGGHAHDLRRLQILWWYGHHHYTSRQDFAHNVDLNGIGGFYRAHLTFPPEYPHLPPKMTFQTPIFHPNGIARPFPLYSRVPANTNAFPPVYPSGDVCISILHAPTNDPYGYESASERWSPVQTPETILLSVISMLSSPNDESPANVEAARMWREDLKEFRKRSRANVRASLGEE